MAVFVLSSDRNWGDVMGQSVHRVGIERATEGATEALRSRVCIWRLARFLRAGGLKGVSTNPGRLSRSGEHIVLGDFLWERNGKFFTLFKNVR